MQWYWLVVALALFAVGEILYDIFARRGSRKG